MDKNNIDRILAGLKDAVEIAEGRASPATYRVYVPEAIDVKSIRRRWGLTQVDFAARFGFSIGNVRDWEQGRKQPEPTNRVLLKVIDKEPEAVRRALQID